MLNHRDAPGRILVVDDEEDMRNILERRLTRAGYTADCVESGEAALAQLSMTAFDAVLLDLNMPTMSGTETLLKIRATHRLLPVVILTADDDTASIVRSVREGAFDFLVKPVNAETLTATLERAVANHRSAVNALGERGGDDFGLIGDSPALDQLRAEMTRVAAYDISVYIRGESGAGKELVAQGIHNASARAGKKLVAVNCAAIPVALQESEFFGHEKGAFTGADSARDGFFAEVSGGTLFLDEVAELDRGLQAKLLRVLQERRFRRVGSQKDRATDFRLVVATHRQLRDEVAAGRFREDLYYRIVVYELEVPPLRARGEDVLVLGTHFLRSLSRENETPTFDVSVRRAMLAYSWPGNVREVKNAMQRAVVSCDGDTVTLADLPPALRAVSVSDLPDGSDGDEAADDEPMTMAQIERRAIVRALKRCDNNRSQVCRQLGVSRTTLYRKMKEYGLDPEGTG